MGLREHADVGDIQTIDAGVAKNLAWLLENPIDDLDLQLTFSLDASVFGKLETVKHNKNAWIDCNFAYNRWNWNPMADIWWSTMKINTNMVRVAVESCCRGGSTPFSVRLVADVRTTGAVAEQLSAFCAGFYAILPKQ